MRIDHPMYTPTHSLINLQSNKLVSLFMYNRLVISFFLGFETGGLAYLLRQQIDQFCVVHILQGLDVDPQSSSYRVNVQTKTSKQF